MTDNSSHDKFADLRRRAEEALANSSAPHFDAASLEDVRHLLSELQVDQIELEMQNEELRQAQEQLAAEREKYADLYNFAPAAYFTVDQDDVILNLNIAAAELLGNEPRYLTGRPIAPYLTSDSLQTFILHRNQARDLRSPQTCELTIRRRDGTQAIVQTRTIALENSERPLWRSVMTDITEQKRNAEALRESEERYRTLVDLSPDGIGIYQEGRLVFLNPAALNMLGAKETSELAGKSPIDMIHPDFRELAQSRSQQLQHGMSIPFIKQKLLRVDGSSFDAETITIPFTYHGAPALQVIFRDITEREQAEEAKRKSEQQYHEMFIQHSAVKLLIDPASGAIVQANPAAAKFYGYPVESLQAMNIQQINTLPDGKIMEAMHQAIDWTNNHFIFQHRLASGEERDVEVYATPIQVGERKLLYSIVHDVTERRRAMEKLRESEEKFRSIAEQSTDMIAITDMKGNILYVSRASRTLFGFRPIEMQGRPFAEFLETSSFPKPCRNSRMRFARAARRGTWN